MNWICAFLPLFLAVPALAAPADDLRCRDGIGGLARRATGEALRRLDICHRQRAGGAADCNGSQRAVLSADLGGIADRCAAAGAARAGYPDAEPLAAIAALIDSEVMASGAALQGAVAFGPDERLRRCHATIGRQRSQLVRGVVTRAIACQRALDRGAPLDSLAPGCLQDGGSAKARAARAISRACSGVDGAAVGSCAPLPGCATDAAVTTARAIAAALYGATAGVAAVFDLDADLGAPAAFYDLPFPTDLRLRPDGTPDLDAWPIATNRFIASIKSIADRRPAFPTVPVIYLRFTAPVAAQAVDQVIAADPAAPLLLVDVDPASPDRGRLFPLVATNPPPDAYVPANALAIATLPGVVLPAGRQYGLIVTRGLTDAAGAPLGVPLALLQLRQGGTPPGVHAARARQLYAPLWETLDQLGVPRDTVAAATVFTVGDVVAALAAESDGLIGRDPVTVEGLALDEVHARFCELRGQVRLPQYQRGVPPFDTEGDFVFGADGLPVLQREESAPVVITIPRQTMPAGGYPLVLYFHGSGGEAAQVVDRGPVSVVGGMPAAGEGPAHVHAARGIATVGSAHPLNPERLPGAASRAYLNLVNLAAYPYTFRQGTIEQRLLLDALGRLTIEPAALAGCDGVGLPSGETAVRLRTDAVVGQGQSMGGQYVNYIAAIEPRIGAAIPTGSGGLWGLVALLASVGDIDTRPLIGPVLLGTTQPLTHLHPGLALTEIAWEWAESPVFAARLAADPLPGHPARAIYQPVGTDDPGFPNPIYALMAVASGTELAGAALEPLVAAALAAAGRGDLLSYPVVDNAQSSDGQPYTGVVAQYVSDGIMDGHHISFQLDAVKHQYGCFARSYFDGRPTVAAPAPLGSPCP